MVKNALELVKELSGTVCFCSKNKQTKQTFCRAHYFSLPPEMRQALYARLGNGYAEAYEAARKYFEHQEYLKAELQNVEAVQ